MANFMLRQFSSHLRSVFGHRAFGATGAPKKRVALVGAGPHSRTCHAPALKEYASRHGDKVELAAVCVRTIAKAQKFCRKFGFKTAYSNIEEMLAHEKLDACICVLPTDQIAASSTLFFRHGVPVLLEKPIALTVSELESLLEAARETGTPHMVSLNRRYNPCLTAAVSWCKEQGEIKYISGSLLRHGRTDKKFLQETGIHALDAICSIGGDISNCRINELRDCASNAAWHVINLEFKSGCRAVLEVLPTSGVHQETYQLHGLGFSAISSLMGEKGPVTVLCSGGKRKMIFHPHLSGQPSIDGSFEETTKFLEAILHNRKPHPTVFDVEMTTRFLIPGYRHEC
jgi:predicted dehydrogenase